MPETPAAPVVNIVGQVFASAAPSQASYFTNRVTAFRSAGNFLEGGMAVINTIGQRLKPGSVATQLYPTGLAVH